MWRCNGWVLPEGRGVGGSGGGCVSGRSPRPAGIVDHRQQPTLSSSNRSRPVRTDHGLRRCSESCGVSRPVVGRKQADVPVGTGNGWREPVPWFGRPIAVAGPRLFPVGGRVTVDCDRCSGRHTYSRATTDTKATRPTPQHPNRGSSPFRVYQPNPGIRPPAPGPSPNHLWVWAACSQPVGGAGGAAVRWGFMGYPVGDTPEPAAQGRGAAAGSRPPTDPPDLCLRAAGTARSGVVELCRLPRCIPLPVEAATADQRENHHPSPPNKAPC